MITTKKNIILGVFAAAAIALYATTAFGAITSDESTAAPQAGGLYRQYTFLSATTTSATSTDVVAGFDADGRYDNGSLTISGAKKVTLLFSRGDNGGNTGTSTFSVQVSPNGTDWYNFDRLIGSDVSATAASSVSIAAATSTVYASMDLTNHTFKSLRCIVVETTDGSHTCKAVAEY